MAKDIEIIGREMVIVSPHEEYTMPDNIADQLIARGKAKLTAPVAPVEQSAEKATKTKRGGKE
jgi:precorrin-6B methylase 1